MVGHSGILSAAIRAVQTVDTCLSRVVPAVLAAGGVVPLLLAEEPAQSLNDRGRLLLFASNFLNLLQFSCINVNRNSHTFRLEYDALIFPCKRY
jgi:2,3-bisphosphoglycerate-independent phosphoglycerate mutase